MCLINIECAQLELKIIPTIKARPIKHCLICKIAVVVETSSSAQLLVNTTASSPPPYRRRRTSSFRDQFSLLANRLSKLVSSVSFQLRASNKLRIETPTKESSSENMSSRSHRRINFNVSEQYEIIDVIGEGAYGVVAYGPLKWSVLMIDPLYIGPVDRKLRLKR